MDTNRPSRSAAQSQTGQINMPTNLAGDGSFGIGKWQWDLEADRVTYSDDWKRLRGLAEIAITESPQESIRRVHPEDLEELKTHRERLIRDGDRFAEFDHRVRHENGNWIWITERIRTVCDEHGQVKILLGCDIEITSRKQNELQSKQAEFTFQEAQSQLERITENVPGMIYRYVQRTDGSHAMPYVGPRCRELFEVEPNSAMENADNIFKTIHQDDLQRVMGAIRISAEQLVPFKEEFRVNLPKQGLRWLQDVGQPNRTENGDTVWDGVIVDVTDRKEVELENDLLAKATKAKNEFLANMSHELRTPLSAILAMTDGLRQKLFGETTPKQEECLSIVEQSGMHLLDLINEVLELAKNETGQMDLEISHFDVKKTCESSIRLVAQQAEDDNIQLVLNVPDNMAKVEADEKRIRQLLINLLSNAVKFTPSGGTVTLEVQQLSRDGDSVTEGTLPESLRLAVSDTGIGIEADQAELIFQPFVQVDSTLSRSFEGAGLGLALVKQYVQSHSGTIQLESEPGKGSCFIVELPYLQQPGWDAQDRNANTTEVPLRPTNDSTESATSENSLPALVLLAEDNDHVATAVIPVLEVAGFQVLRAENGLIAIEIATEQLPDVILMDIQMPVMDGLEATRRIRATPKVADIPIIALSGFAMPEDSSRCIEAGANAFVSKPCRMDELVKHIKTQLAAKTSGKQHP